jgi:hypothetical protein
MYPMDWQAFFGYKDVGTDMIDLHSHSTTGRPLGFVSFVSSLEELTGRIMFHQKSEPKIATKLSEP